MRPMMGQKRRKVEKQMEEHRRINGSIPPPLLLLKHPNKARMPKMVSLNYRKNYLHLLFRNLA
jgi:hypothetical protein